ncbi:hypothetical protein MKI77_005436, partial [Escherichia coli]|nr:hypothetical protein [Escherichia coli]
ELIVVFLRSPDGLLHGTVTSVSPYAMDFQFATGLPKAGLVKGVNGIKALNLCGQCPDRFLLLFRQRRAGTLSILEALKSRTRLAQAVFSRGYLLTGTGKRITASLE